ncbi:hypothetical protein HPP92_004272 [Vanilla planifolia]|uniref:Uncharacterized protein n=1 Tax=Vanilla planifolia TaxID=51239 RepID=A0A835RWE3_VANPL|nr:hypothetical protein HPP92_004272 [Vanilla planifolia]
MEGHGCYSLINLASEAKEASMVAGQREYTVRISRKETVAAALPMQEHWLPLSNLDLLLPPLDVGVFFCYTKPTPAANDTRPSTFSAVLKVLKASLAKALITYYPFAGELVTNSSGEPELLCNNRGVDFIEAHAEVDLAELDFHDADQGLEKLIPEKKHGVLTIQATEMTCGGMVLGCKFDHRVADAYSFNMFLVGWAEMAAAKPSSVHPSFRRSLLDARRPLHVDPTIDHFFVPVSTLPPPQTEPLYNCVNRIYYIDVADVERLQVMAGSGRTKLEAFAAYLWKLVGRATPAQMGLVVDGRRRLGPVMDGYFGNVLSIPYAEMAVGAMTMEEVAAAVHGMVEEAASEGHFRGLVDWVEAMRPDMAVARVYAEEGLSVVVSSGRGFPVREVEFGWGKAVMGSYHFPWKGEAGYVMPMPSAKGNGDWLVYAHIAREVVDAIDAEAGNVLRRVSAEYLRLK